MFEARLKNWKEKEKYTVETEKKSEGVWENIKKAKTISKINWVP